MLAKAAARRSERMALIMTRLHELSDDVYLSTEETAAVVNRSTNTLKWWRCYSPDHPLRWRKRGSRVEYRVGDVREYLRAENQAA